MPTPSNPKVPNPKFGQRLTLLYDQTVKDEFGIFHISVYIRGIHYVYAINSEFAHRKFLRAIKYSQFGKALQILKRFKIEAFHGKEKEEIAKAVPVPPEFRFRGSCDCSLTLDL